MSSYENDQDRLKKLWDEVLSASEEDFSPDVSEYEPSDSVSSSEEDAEIPRKQIKVCRKSAIPVKNVSKDENMPSTSFTEDFVPPRDVIPESGLVLSDVSNITSSKVEPTPLSFDNIDKTIEMVIQQNLNYEQEEALDENEIDRVTNISWSPVTGMYLRKIPLTVTNSGIQTSIYESYLKRPYDFYKMMINDDIIDMFVSQTNLYAEQQKVVQERVKKSRIHAWRNTNREEMEKFLGCIMWMGLVQLPSITSYWSTDVIYKNFAKGILSRNRFQLLLKTWHFANNENVPEGDRLYKITPLIKKLLERFQAPIVPGEFICIDETLVPFKGKLKFKQYISNKRHKFGIKLFKLCLKNGYLFDLSIYCGQEKEPNQEQTVPSSVVLKLTQNLLDAGRTIVVDNYYTSIELASALLERNTYILGTLRSNRRNNSKNVISKKLKKGEHIAEESNTGIFMEKWRDKRDVIMLTTKFVPELITQRKRTGEINKPKSVVEYNKHKAYIDISDQMKAYNSSLRRGVKWYRKLAIELVVGSAVVNAYIIHQEVTQNKMTITKFRESVIKDLIKSNDAFPLPSDNSSSEHVLEDSEKKRSCSGCYARISKASGRIIAKNRTPKTKFQCNVCQRYYCLPCFFSCHVTYSK